MNWEQLLSLKRFGDTNKRLRKEQDETRLGFEVDYDRVIFSSEFRSLQDKTQVIPLSQTDFVHTRLTHSLEVSVVGRSIGRKVGQELLDKHPHLQTVHGYQANDFGAIVAAAALAHDIGNPPFGHSGEKAIGEFFKTGEGAQFKSQLKSRDELSRLNLGTFKESKSLDRVFYIESFDELGSSVKNIFAQTKHNNKLGVVIASNGHREISSKGDNYIILQKGRRYEGIPNTKEFSTTEFDQYGILTAQQPVEPYIESIDSKKLSDVIKSNTLGDRLELQWRIAAPISCILLVFLAIPLSFTNPRAGRSLNIIFAVLIFIIYNNLLAIMNTLITLKKVSVTIGFWPIHLIFLLAAIYFTYKRSVNQPLFNLKSILNTK